MDQLKLKYILQLVSDIGPKAKSDAEALTTAQKLIQKELENTSQKIGLTERALLNMGRVGSASAERQAQYLGRLALKYHEVKRAAEGAVDAMGKAAKFGAQAAAGAAAGAYAADRVTKAPMEYSLRLAHMANTAFSERNAAGRIAGKDVLDAAIRAATKQGGGTRDEAASALDTLIASNALSVSDAIKTLPMITKAGSASGAGSAGIADITVDLIRNLKLKPEQVQEALNMAMVSGQAGGFELKDMPQWLPQLVAIGGQSGLGGMEGLKKILSAAQASVITAGSKNAAGNNLVNFLGKINSPDTANDFKKLGYDLPAELVNAKAKGINSIDAFLMFSEQIAQADPRYAKLKKQLDAQSAPGERRDTLEAMTSIMMGSAVGKVVQDRQALTAMLALMNNKKYVAQVEADMAARKNEIDTSFSVISSQTGYKKQQTDNDFLNAAQDSFEKVAPAINKVFETASNLAREFPTLTTTAVTAAGALTVLAAAAGASGLAGILLGRGGAGAAGAAGGLVGRVAGGAAAAGAASGASAMFPGLLALAKRLGGGGAMLASELFLTSDADLEVLNAADARKHSRGYGYRDPRLMSMTAPGAAAASTAEAIAAVESNALGVGRVVIEVQAKDGSAASIKGMTDSPRLRMDAGNTNPAGY